MADAERGGNPLRSLPVVALVILAVLAAAVGVWLLLSPPQVRAESQAERSQAALTVANRYAVRVNTFDVQDLDSYRERVEPLITPALDKQFQTSTTGLLAKFEKTRLATQASVVWSAVESIDGDSAEVLSAIDVDATPQGIIAQQPRYRWRIALVERGGEWKVDNFAAITIQDAAANGQGAAAGTGSGEGDGS